MTTIKTPLVFEPCVDNDGVSTAVVHKAERVASPLDDSVSWQHFVDYRIFWSHEDNGFIAHHQKEEGLSAFGETLQELMTDIEAVTYLAFEAN